MATKTQMQNFIKTLSALAMAEAKKREKWVLPSVCIAQAALETGYGTSSLMTKANAYFGIKATASWKGKVYNAKTKECYDGSTFTDITACFRAYDSLADSVADYFDLITKSRRYASAVNNTDAKATITAIKNGGYATDPTYISKVMAIITAHNLTQYDDFADHKEEKEAEAPEAPATAVLKVGDIVNFTGDTHYTSANASKGKKCKKGKAKITAVYQYGKSKHPYHVKRTGIAGPYGWVDASDIEKATTAEKKPVATIKVGSIVRVKKGAKTYTGESLKDFVYKRNHHVKSIVGNRVVITFSGIVVAAVHKDDLTLV